jgi:hypothetical protein
MQIRMAKQEPTKIPGLQIRSDIKTDIQLDIQSDIGLFKETSIWISDEMSVGYLIGQLEHRFPFRYPIGWNARSYLRERLAISAAISEKRKKEIAIRRELGVK